MSMMIHGVVSSVFVLSLFGVLTTGRGNPLGAARLVRVDQSGRGNYRSIQEAIDSVPSGNSESVFIWVKPGVYREKVLVPKDKPFITLSGTKPNDTVVSWNDTGSIYDSPTLTLLAHDVTIRLLTIENSYGKAKAVALRVSADRVSILGCKILGYQDTLLDDTGRHYYKNCYIEGATDFICGNAASLFEKCHIHTVSMNAGAITAQRRQSPSENTGFTFLGCKITGARGGSATLGRPWGDYSRVVFAFTYMTNVILPQGWDNWRDPSRERTAYYGEYKCYGQGAVKSRRVTWSRNLTTVEAQPFLTKDMIDAGRLWIK